MCLNYNTASLYTTTVVPTDLLILRKKRGTQFWCPCIDKFYTWELKLCVLSTKLIFFLPQTDPAFWLYNRQSHNKFLFMYVCIFIKHRTFFHQLFSLLLILLPILKEVKIFAMNRNNIIHSVTNKILMINVAIDESKQHNPFCNKQNTNDKRSNWQEHMLIHTWHNNFHSVSFIFSCYKPYKRVTYVDKCLNRNNHVNRIKSLA